MAATTPLHLALAVLAASLAACSDGRDSVAPRQRADVLPHDSAGGFTLPIDVTDGDAPFVDVHVPDVTPWSSDSTSADLPGLDAPAPLDATDLADPGGAQDTTVATDTAKTDGGLPICGDETVTIEDVAPASVLFVLDRSGSMKGQKWTDAKGAIKDITSAYEASLRFGLLMYPKADDLCIVANNPDVPFALGNAGFISTALDAASLKDGTPTGGAMVAASQLIGFLDPASPRVVVLATDGSPTCPSNCAACTTPETGMCVGGNCSLCINEKDCIRHELESTVTGLAASGVKTYVIGLPGSDKAADNLNAMAEAGGTALPGETKYYVTDDAAALATALATIAGSVSSCNAHVNPTPGYAFISVTVDGQKVNKDPTHQSGWDLLDGDIVQFYGEACSAASADGADVSITFICKH